MREDWKRKIRKNKNKSVHLTLKNLYNQRPQTDVKMVARVPRQHGMAGSPRLLKQLLALRGIHKDRPAGPGRPGKDGREDDMRLGRPAKRAPGHLGHIGEGLGRTRTPGGHAGEGRLLEPAS